MSFKANLLKKIEVDALSQAVIQTIGPPGSGAKIDQGAMRKLLSMSPYTHQRERDLDLYLGTSDDGQVRILVLDNELALYHTSLQDVALRKSPTVKEMLSIRNVIKILNDKDAITSKGEATVRTIQASCLQDLDLSFGASDLEDLAREGKASLESNYGEGVVESLTLLSELLGYQAPPKLFTLRHTVMRGKIQRQQDGELHYGPFFIYSRIHNTLGLIDRPVGSFDKEKLAWIQQVGDGQAHAPVEGLAVFDYLHNAVSEIHPR
jgi:hypothetical protein